VGRKKSCSFQSARIDDGASYRGFSTIGHSQDPFFLNTLWICHFHFFATDVVLPFDIGLVEVASQVFQTTLAIEVSFGSDDQSFSGKGSKPQTEKLQIKSPFRTDATALLSTSRLITVKV